MQTQVNNESIYNFQVALKPVFDEDGNVIPRVRNVQRQDNRKSLAVVSDRYKLIPHQRMVDAFEPFARSLGTHTTRYFQERDGARVIIEQTYPEVTFRVPGHNIPGRGREVGDVVALRTYSSNSYDTTTPLSLRVGCLVLRCLNGATALDSFFGLSIKHIGKGEPEINLPAPEAVLASFQSTGNSWEEWAHLSLGEAGSRQLFDQAKHYGLAGLGTLEREKPRFLQSETLWDFYNAATHVITHESTRIKESSRLNRFDRLNMLVRSFTNPTTVN